MTALRPIILAYLDFGANSCGHYSQDVLAQVYQLKNRGITHGGVGQQRFQMKVFTMNLKIKRLVDEMRQAADLLDKLDCELADVKIRTGEEKYELCRAFNYLFTSLKHHNIEKAKLYYQLEPREGTEDFLSMFAYGMTPADMAAKVN